MNTNIIRFLEVKLYRNQQPDKTTRWRYKKMYCNTLEDFSKSVLRLDFRKFNDLRGKILGDFLFLE
jgi:hypothetical protein